MIRILIADDHVLIREGLKKIIASAPDMSVIGEAQSGAEVFTNLQKQIPDVLVLDISFPDRNGLEILKELKQEYTQLPVLILSMHPEERFAFRFLKAGASGYLNKDCAAEKLINAIRKIVQGRKYISPSLGEKLAFELHGEMNQPLHETLSNRESLVMSMIASGKAAREIADELQLSINTINTYRRRILQKMKMKKDAEVIRYALQHGLVD